MSEQKHYADTLKYFETVANEKAGIYDEGNSIAMKIQRKVRENIIKMIRPSVTSILDAGCGRGDFTALLSNTFSRKKVVGIDFSHSMINIAERKYGKDSLKFLQSSLTAIKLQDNSVDSSICLNVLHHLKPNDISIAINELCRVAKYQVVIEFKNNLSPYHVIKKVVVPKSIGAQIFGANIFQLREKFKENDFRVTTTWSLLFGPYISPIVCVAAERC